MTTQDNDDGNGVKLEFTEVCFIIDTLLKHGNDCLYDGNDFNSIISSFNMKYYRRSNICDTKFKETFAEQLSRKLESKSNYYLNSM